MRPGDYSKAVGKTEDIRPRPENGFYLRFTGMHQCNGCFGLPGNSVTVFSAFLKRDGVLGRYGSILGRGY